MFVATMEWVLTNNTDIATRFLWSKKKKMSPAYVRWIMGRLTINDNEKEASWEASMMFLADKAANFVGQTYKTEQDAMNYVFAAYGNWFRNKIKKLQRHDAKFVPLDELTIGVTEMNTESKMEDIIAFVAMSGEEAQFFMHYLMMGKQEQGLYWRDERKRIAYCGRVVSKQTFYNRLGAFKKGLRNYLEGEEK